MLPGLVRVFYNLFTETNYAWKNGCERLLLCLPAMPTAGERWFAVTVKAENGCEKGVCPWEGSGCARPPTGNAVRVWPSQEGCLVGMGGMPGNSWWGSPPPCHTSWAAGFCPATVGCFR